MPDIRIGNNIYHIPDDGRYRLYVPVTDLSKPALSKEELILKEEDTNNKLGRTGYIHTNSLNVILANHILGLENVKS